MGFPPQVDKIREKNELFDYFLVADAGSDFVCVEDMGKLNTEHDALQKRVEQIEKNLAEIERVRQEVGHQDMRIK